MFVDTKNYILPLFTAFWLFLLFFIGNSFLSYYFFLLFLIVSLFFLKYLDFSLLKSIEKYSFSWIALLVFSGFSFFWTQNIPYTLDYYFYFLFLFYVFHFFFLIKKKVFDLEIFFKSLSFVGLVLIVFSLLFSYFSGFGQQLPQMSLLYSATGHTHLSVLSLFFTPLLFFYFLKNKDRKYLFLMGTYSLYGFLSMGRIISIILLFQHLIIFFIVSKNGLLFGLDKKYFLNYFKVFFAFLFIIISTWFLILGRCENLESNSFDLIKTCRVGSANSRAEYWRNSGKVFKDNYFTGVGLGNYSFFSRKYIESRSATSSHPHNYFFKMFAELGVIGGILFSFIFVGLFIKGFKKTIKENTSINTFLSISLMGIYINVFFDYDWNFEGIFILTLIFLSIFVSKKKDSVKVNEFFKKIFYTVFFICFLFLSFYSMIDFLVFTGNEKKAFEMFPVSKWHSILYAKSNQLDIEDKKQLYHLNEKNNLVLNALSTENIDKDFKKEILKKTNDFYGWDGFHLSLNYLNDSSFSLDEKKELISELVLFLEDRVIYSEELLSHEALINFIEKIFFIADEFYMNGDYQAAGELYALTTNLDKWSLDYNKPIFLYKDLDRGTINFFANLDNIEAEYLGQYEQHYKKFAQSSIDIHLSFENYDLDLVKKVEEIINYWNEEK